jgi:Fic family protein
MSTAPTRAGRYLSQPTGYRAFIPAPLPPDPPVRLAGELQNLLSQADRALGRLDGSIQTLPNPDLFVFMYVRKEAVLSSQIEGTQSYVRAMNYGLEHLEHLPVSTRLIREIHTRLLEGVRGSQHQPGELRSTQNWIGPEGCTLAEATFVPPPPHELPSALRDLEAFLHQDNDMPLLIKIGLAHAQFETIHPFLDGNGRVGRLLITFLLCEREVLAKPVLYLSYYFKRHRSAYYERLQAVRDRGDWEGWLAFFLRGIAAVSAQATDTARRILALREAHRALITAHFGRAAGNGHRVLEYLYERPIVSVNEVKDLTGSSYQAANTLVRRMEEHGILREFTGRSRNRRFRYEDYVLLFVDAEPEGQETDE